MLFKEKQSISEEEAQFGWVCSVGTHRGHDEVSDLRIDVDIGGDGGAIFVEQVIDITNILTAVSA